jgi:hypothetical protein
MLIVPYSTRYRYMPVPQKNLRYRTFGASTFSTAQKYTFNLIIQSNAQLPRFLTLPASSFFLRRTTSSPSSPRSIPFWGLSTDALKIEWSNLKSLSDSHAGNYK